MYRTAPQIIFQFVGGFATAQYTYPILFNSFQRRDGASSTGSGTSSSLSGGGISIPYADSISNAWGKVKKSVPLDRFTTPRSLSEDVEALLLSYRTLSVIILSLVVTSGGAPALIGAGLSLYCDGGPEGRARYAALKKKWHELNNS